MTQAARARPTPLALAAAVVLTAAVVAAPPARAQAGSDGPGSRYDLTLGATYGTVEGDDFERSREGVGGILAVRRSLGGSLSVGVGGHYRSHDFEFLDSRLKLLGVYVSPRLDLPAGGLPFTPFVGGRAGFARWSLDATVDRRSASFSAAGFEAGATAGARVPVRGPIALELRGVASALEFGNLTAEGDGSEVRFSEGELPFSRSSGALFAAEAGVTVSF